MDFIIKLVSTPSKLDGKQFNFILILLLRTRAGKARDISTSLIGQMHIGENEGRELRGSENNLFKIVNAFVSKK